MILHEFGVVKKRFVFLLEKNRPSLLGAIKNLTSNWYQGRLIRGVAYRESAK